MEFQCGGSDCEKKATWKCYCKKKYCKVHYKRHNLEKSCPAIPIDEKFKADKIEHNQNALRELSVKSEKLSRFMINEINACENINFKIIYDKKNEAKVSILSEDYDRADKIAKWAREYKEDENIKQKFCATTKKLLSLDTNSLNQSRMNKNSNIVKLKSKKYIEIDYDKLKNAEKEANYYKKKFEECEKKIKKLEAELSTYKKKFEECEKKIKESEDEKSTYKKINIESTDKLLKKLLKYSSHKHPGENGNRLNHAVYDLIEKNHEKKNPKSPKLPLSFKKDFDKEMSSMTYEGEDDANDGLRRIYKKTQEESSAYLAYLEYLAHLEHSEHSGHSMHSMNLARLLHLMGLAHLLHLVHSAHSVNLESLKTVADFAHAMIFYKRALERHWEFMPLVHDLLEISSHYEEKNLRKQGEIIIPGISPRATANASTVESQFPQDGKSSNHSSIKKKKRSSKINGERSEKVIKKTPELNLSKEKMEFQDPLYLKLRESIETLSKSLTSIKSNPSLLLTIPKNL
ncbi:hypothetical protein SteCoe_32200 [Stentor coeruleus]|uniref:Uncharacterized protein n=1 Tax=Stentor coeruleus TaxID=5963 RepID=A0A1R2AZI2_9CILI|nr:hypothetical protein SteCoe_32200 [Stentor coeruleus]